MRVMRGEFVTDAACGRSPLVPSSTAQIVQNSNTSAKFVTSLSTLRRLGSFTSEKRFFGFLIAPSHNLTNFCNL